MQDTAGEQKLTLENQKKLYMSGVDSVDSFSDKVGGSKVLIGGEGIKITAYNKGNGALTADGKFDSIRYDANKAPFFKRIFK